MRKVDVSRLSGKIERIAADLYHDVGRLRSAGHGPSAEALALCYRQLENIAHSLRSQGRLPRTGRGKNIDITEMARVVGKGAR